jgi:hypothetical protein
MLEVDDLVAGYAGVPALQNVSLKLAQTTPVKRL